MSAKRTAIFSHGRGKQRGVALMIMLVILVVGIAAVLVNSLTSSTVKTARQENTAAALAQAKDALIGRAIKDATSPGSLPCPDTNDDGSAESTVGQPGGNCSSYIGRLPWKTLGLPDLRDGSGERLWYALSPNFRDYVTLNPINSNSIGILTVSGTSAASNVIAIVFAAGPPVSGQSRSSTNQVACATSGSTIAESWCATNYLEGTNPAPSPQTTPNLNYQSADTSSTFNDRLMIISAGDIIPIVEMRVAKELTNAFASYLAANGKYPYPANFTTTCTPTSTTSCPSDSTQCIGKVPATQMNLYTTLPWFTDNKWFDVIYYTAGTSSLLGGAGGGGGGAGKKGKGKGKGGGGGGGSGGGSTICPANNTSTLTVLNPDGTTLTSNASALFLMPDTPLGGITRTSMSSTNLPDYFEDAENQNLDNLYIMPTAISNDSLYILP